MAIDPDWPEPSGFADEDLLSLIRRQGEHYGYRRFMSFQDGSSMSFLELRDRVAGMRARLQDMGVRPGDRVALMLKNSLFYPVAWLGIVTGGATAVPINSRLKGHDAGYILGHSGSRVVVTDNETHDVVLDAIKRSKTHSELMKVRTGDPMPEIVGEDVGAPPPAGELANIQYTSGTTGFPKGCMLTHAYWQWMGAVSKRAMELDERDTILTSQPHSYIDPQWQVIAALRGSVHLVLLNGFHPSTFMRSIVEWRVTVFYCLGVMPALLLRQPEKLSERDHSLRRVYCSAIPVRLHAEIEERWGVPWLEAFGMTESGLNTIVGQSEHAGLVGTGCIGRALPHNEAAVLGPAGDELPAGAPGELALRGDGFMNGYYKDPEPSEAFFAGGWAHTGDVVEMDEDKRIYYRGRSKEMIRRAGENISPAEIETVLGSHPDVIECAVTPVPDAVVEEEIKAWVVVRPDSSVTAADLHGFLGARLARFKVPRYYEFREELPHTSSERVVKHQLGEPLNDATIDIPRAQ